MPPKISVLMSCYNGSRWLREAIDSVLSQTFVDFELILVDDGSTDETWKIIQSYRDRDNRIVAISKKNTGVADSLNVGISQARGAWVARLDQDDICEPTRLEEQFSFVCAHPAVILLGAGFYEIDEYGRDLMKHRCPSGHSQLLRRLERMQSFFPHSSAFYRVDEVRKAGGYNPRLPLAEDWRLWPDLALRGEIACLPRCLVRIRKHSGQVSRESRRQLRDGMAATVCYFLRKAGCQDPSVDASADEWIIFLNWVDDRIRESGYYDRRIAWGNARDSFFARGSWPVRILRFAISLMWSGHAVALVCEKVIGTSLPMRISREWVSANRRSVR